MFIPYGAKVRHATKLTAAEKAAQVARQVEKLAGFAVHADRVAEAVLPHINPAMTWEERLEVFKATETELGRVATGGEELHTGGWAPMYRPGVYVRMRAV